jgi:hypothetical protein
LKICNYLAGDCCGLIYAVNGVCHHMSARILWACENTPILWPDSVTASYWVWFDRHMGTGFYGNNWYMFKPIFEKWKSGISFVEISELQNIYRQNIKDILEPVKSNEIMPAITEVLPTLQQELDNKVNDAILEHMSKFWSFKNDFDKQLLNDTISRDEYASQLNVKYKKIMLELANTMNAKNYKELFGIEPGKLASIGIDPNKIPSLHILNEMVLH